MNADQLNHDTARRQEGTMSDEARKVLEEFAKPVSFGAPMWDERKAVGALLAENAAQAGLIAKLTGWDRERTEQLAVLSGFKSYVHQRLDEAGIPTHPDGPHSKEGCRIGDRLDIALKKSGCDGCGTIGVEYVKVRVTNGALKLCRQCLDDINHKSPLLAAAKAENERLKVENAKWPSQWIREIDKAVAAERAAQDGAALAALRKEQDAFNAEVRELQDINARLLRERDAALALVETLKSNRYRELLADACIERDAAVQAKERAEADAAVLGQIAKYAGPGLNCVCRVCEMHVCSTACPVGRALAAENPGAALLEELHQLRKDAGYDGHPNSRAALAQQPDQRKDG